MTPKERFLNALLLKPGKERWVAALLLSAPPFVLKEITGSRNYPFTLWGGKRHGKVRSKSVV